MNDQIYRRGRGVLVLVVLLWVTPVWAQRSSGRSPDQFDPLGFPGDDSVVTAGARPAIPELLVTPAPANDSTPAEPRVHEFWQVQFFATPDWTEADDLRQRAQEALQDTVSVDFETPYYKLRVGQFSERDEADKLVVKLRAMGYESAWVVRREGGDGPR